MEDLQALHRKQVRDLQSRITQKKKSATKKTRKGVNEECDRLEQDLKERQAQELESLAGKNAAQEECDEEKVENDMSEHDRDGIDFSRGDLVASTKELSISSGGITVPSGERQPQSHKPNRQKARLARRAAEQEAIAATAAEEAAQLPDLREKERAAMVKEFERRHLKEHDIRPDGHCLYSAVADQIRGLGLDLKLEKAQDDTSTITNADQGLPDYKIVRQVTAQHISQHSEDFIPFLDEALESYVQKIRDTAEWGGQIELMALASAYGVIINVLQGDGRLEKIEPGQSGGDRGIWLAYYRHSFGLGEHYNSLRFA